MNEKDIPVPPAACQQIVDTFVANANEWLPGGAVHARRLQEVARATVCEAKDHMDGLDFTVVKPKPFQQLGIPYALNGANMIIASETGSGKTLLFLMATFMNAFPHDAQNVRGLRALVLVPTGYRQLVLQHQITFERVAQRLHDKGDPFWGRVPNIAKAVVCTTFVQTGRQGAAAAGGVARDDRRDLFEDALIRIDTPDRIRGIFSQVSVISIDEADKIVGNLTESDPQKTKDRTSAQRLIACCPDAQIISASATIVRLAESQASKKRDPTTDWLRSVTSNSQRALISLQTQNVMPPSVFHLFVDLRSLRTVDLQQSSISSWEKFHTVKGNIRGPSLCLYGSYNGIEDKVPRIESSFTDKTHISVKPALVVVAKAKSIMEKSADLRNLSTGTKSGCLSTKNFATGMDLNFSAVLFSDEKLFHHDFGWADYVHSSGRCGRKPNTLGLSVIFIRNDVRGFIFLTQI